MGNCTDEFQNIPDINELQILEKQRIKNSVIGPQHKILQPSHKNIIVGIINKEIKQFTIDNQKMHNTINIKQNNIISFKKQSISTQEEEFISSDHCQEELTMKFYHSLALEQYHYRAIPIEYQAQFYKVQSIQSCNRYGVIYNGEWCNDKPHGNGILKSNTFKYLGQFRNGLKHFHGRQIMTREVYEGEFRFNIRRGQGTRYSSDRVEVGQFDCNLVFGTITYVNGNIYRGKLQNSKYHDEKGFLFQHQTKIEYYGNFDMGEFTGKGIINYPNKTKYIGEVKKGMKYGYGEFRWDQLNYYKGHYVNDVKHGQGIMNFIHKDKQQEVQLYYQNGIEMTNFEDKLNQDSFNTDSGLPQAWQQ